MVTITNFTSGLDTLQFGNSSSALTGTQLSSFRFADYGNVAGQIDLNGFVTPVPEPGSVALAVCGIVVTAGIHFRRSHRRKS